MKILPPQTNQQHYIAALDLGSNSFHFVLARLIKQHIQIIYKEKYKVKLAQGLDNNSQLSDAAIMRAIATLTSLASTTAKLHKDNFRIVATNALRKASNKAQFLAAAKAVFPFDIEIISGHEEARLIYQGVNAFTASPCQQLIIDIGGGSTELIIGDKNNVLALASLEMGSVSFTKQYFQQNLIQASQFQRAIAAVTSQVSLIAKRYQQINWQQVIGTSGAIKAIHSLLKENNSMDDSFHYQQLLTLQATLLDFKTVDNIKLARLKNSRKPLICASVAILIGIMQALNIKQIQFCKYALRDGVLFELVSNQLEADVRSRTVNSLMQRFNHDVYYHQQLLSLCETLFLSSASEWQLNQQPYLELLLEAAKLHEIGLDINSADFHQHGAYIIRHADMPGFNQEQQQALAWLVANQRKQVTDINLWPWHILSGDKLLKILILLRLSLILSQQRSSELITQCKLSIREQKLKLYLPEAWLIQRPVIEQALMQEQDYLAKCGVSFKIKPLSD